MSANLQAQKKKLTKEGIIVFAVLAVLGSIAGGMTYMASQNEAMIATLQGQFNSYMGQLSDLERKHEIIKESVDEFLKIKKDISAGQYDLNREKALDILAQIGKAHRIDKIDTQLSPVETLTIPEGTFQRADAQFSDVKLTFKTMTDLHAYAFIDDVMQQMPGIKKVTFFRISTLDTFQNDDLVDISQGKKPELIQAEVSFLWLGIRLFPLDPSGIPIPPPPPAGAPAP